MDSEEGDGSRSLVLLFDCGSREIGTIPPSRHPVWITPSEHIYPRFSSLEVSFLGEGPPVDHRSGGSQFTSALLDGLRGGAQTNEGLVTDESLVDYLLADQGRFPKDGLRVKKSETDHHLIFEGATRLHPNIFYHLCGIAILREYIYHHKFFEPEMYWLKDNGFIQTKPPNTDREFYEGIDGKNLAEMWEPTGRGWTYLKLHKEDIGELYKRLFEDENNLNTAAVRALGLEVAGDGANRTISMSEGIFHHLCGIAILREYIYHHKFFEPEMYWLKDNGFIQTKPPNTDREFYEGIDGKNLAEMWEPTGRGWTYLKLHKEDTGELYKRWLEDENNLNTAAVRA